MAAPYPTYSEEIAAEYRESPEYHGGVDCIVCALCGYEVDADDAIEGRYCSECATACDNCGMALLAGDKRVTVREMHDRGRLLVLTYCTECARENCND